MVWPFFKVITAFLKPFFKPFLPLTIFTLDFLLIVFTFTTLTLNIFSIFFFIDDIKKKISKTKIFNNFLVRNKLENVLIISDKETEKNISKSVRNIPNVKLINDQGTNVYDLIKYKNVLFTISSIKNLEQRLANEKN